MAETTDLMKSVRESLVDITLNSLKEAEKGFYGIDFGYDGISGNILLEAEAGIKVADIFTIAAKAKLDPVSGKIVLGTRLGGEIQL